MANKVSILITNTEGHHFELSNSKMAIDTAGRLNANWNAVFGHDISPHDIIISDFQNSTGALYGMGYSFVESCGNPEDADEIIKTCRDMLRQQYERMMMIRVAKKYSLDSMTRLRIELEYHSPENYEVFLKDGRIMPHPDTVIPSAEEKSDTDRKE